MKSFVSQNACLQLHQNCLQKTLFSYLTLNYSGKLKGYGWDWLSTPHSPIYLCLLWRAYIFISIKILYFQHIYLYLLWLSEYPSEFEPMYCRRYVDDSFLLFKSEDQITLFQNYLSDNRSNIKFSGLFLVN